MFPIKCKDLLPIDHLVVKSVAVRGRLGSLTVWISKKDANYNIARNQRYSARRTGSVLAQHVHSRDGESGDKSNIVHRIPLDPSSWIKLHDKKHNPCPPGRYTELVFDEPVRLEPGEMRALYVHSTLPGDQAIVYDNSYYGTSDKRFDDDKITILTGRAHVSTTCFGQHPIWGYGNAWRDRREFVGRLAYGTVYKLWNPEVQPKFGSWFQNGARTLALCQRRRESPLSLLPDEAIFYILNMCRWDWFDDSNGTMKDRRKREMLRKEQEQRQKKLATSMVGYCTNQDDQEDAKPFARGANSSHRSCTQPFENSNTPSDGKSIDSCDEEEEEDDEEEYIDMSDDNDDTKGDEYNEDTSMNSEDVDFDSEGSSEDNDDYHRANRGYFSFKYPDSDDEKTEKSACSSQQNNWFRHHLARVHVLRALASMEDQAISQF